MPHPHYLHLTLTTRTMISRYVHNLIKYEFDWQFEIPATYPTTAPEIELPELDGKGGAHVHLLDI